MSQILTSKMPDKLLNKQVIPLLSVVTLGLSGGGIHILIGRYFDIEVLGQFNSTLAFYLVFAQVGSLGTYMAVLHLFSKPLDAIQADMAWGILATATLIALTGSVGIIFITFLLNSFIPCVWGGNQVIAGMILAASLGIPFFCINKILLAFLNAQNHINSYFLLQAVRYILLLTVLYWMAVSNVSPVSLGHVFWICEGILFLLCLTLVIKYAGKHLLPAVLSNPLNFSGAQGKVTVHSLQALLGGTIQELAVRVDIFILTYFVEPVQVGLYSVAAMVAEGLNQVTGIVRDQLSPRIGYLYSEKRNADLSGLFRKTMIYGYGALFLPALLAVVLFPDVAEWLFSNPHIRLAGPAFAILMVGLYLSSPYHFLFYAPNQMGSPLILTWIVAISTVLNVILNIILIPNRGISGSACATSLSWITAAFILVCWLNKTNAQRKHSSL